MKSLKHFILVLSLGISAASFATITPSSVKIKIFGVAVSTNRDCSSPVSIFSSTTGTEVDMVSAPTLGSGSVPDGTYECVMITISDTVTASTTTGEGSCTANTDFSGGVCHGESTDLFDGTSSSNVACTAGEDRVTLYLHTGTTRTGGGGAFSKPTSTSDATNGYKLDGAFVVSGTSVGTFVVNFTNKLDGSDSGHCELKAPLFGFR